MKIFVFIICLGIVPILISGQTQCETRFDPCVNSTENRNFTEPAVSEGSDRILNSIRAFARVGTGLHDLLSAPAGSRLPLGEVLSEVVPDVLLYLTPVNLSYFEPYINVSSQFLDDLLYQLMEFNLSNAEQSISSLVATLEQGIDIALDILRISFNDPSIEMIIMQIESIRNLPGFRDNLTCILSNAIEDTNIEVILEHLGRIASVVEDIKYLAAPITQLFSNNTRFMDKFEQIRMELDFSFAFQLCVDSMLTNLVCPQIEGLSDGICNRACTDTLSYCTALLFQSLEDFSDVLDAASLLVFEEVKSSEFEQKYNELIGLSVEIVNTTLLALADLDYMGLLNNSITTCGTEIIISEILLSLNITIPPDQVFLIFDIIPDSALENLTDFSYFYQNITQTVLPYQNIRNAIELIILPNGFLLNSLFSLAVQYTLIFYPLMGCFDPTFMFTSSPILIPSRLPNFVNCWNGTDIVVHLSPFSPITEIDSYPSHVGFNPAASRTCSFSISNFQSARIYTQTDLCDEFASVIFNSTRTAKFLASIVSQDSSVLSTCRSTILLLLDGSNITLPTTAPTSLPGCVSNECTNSTSIRTTLSYQLNDGADYIVNTTRTVATIGTSLSEFIDNINDRDALRDFLESTISPALTYLAGINDTDLRPFYGEMFSLANDFFYHILVNFSSDPSETVPHLIRLLERGLSIGVNLTRVILGNDPNISFIFDLIDGVVSTPGLEENVTCILIELFSDPDISEILTQLENLNILTQLMNVAQPILQLFNDSQLFKDKFNEVIDALPTSQALSLCVDSYLANLFCTPNASYCQDNCVDTLNYCTAYLFHSFQDFSNVLDAVLILAAGSVETPQFEEQFNQFREMLFNTTEITLDAVARFDILGFVDRTLRDCNSLPLIGGILSTLPIPAPVVNFQLSTYFASTNINVTVICGGIGTNVQFEIFPLNQTGIEFTLMSPITATQQIILTFVSSSPGNYTFICRGNNSAGDSSSRTMIIVRSLEENIDAIIDIEPDEIVSEETAMNLLSITGSVIGSEEIQNNATVAQQLANTATVIVASLSNTSISTDTAGAILGLLETVENSPALDLTTTSPPSTEEQTEIAVEVSPVKIMVSQAIDILALNLASQVQPGNPPIIVSSTKITIAATTVKKTAGISEYTLPGLPGTEVNIPLGSFSLNAKIQIGAAQRVCPARAQVPAGGTVNLVGSAPLLISKIFNLNIKLDGGEVSILTDPITFALETALIPANGEKVCTFLDEDIGQLVQGNVVTIPSAGVDVTSCQTMHLTSFGVLVRARSIPLSESETLAISIISYILLSTSLIFLVVSIILFLISARSFFKVETNILYFNYALALILATSVFIFGIQSARNSHVGCSIVGFLLHYTWLSVFSWSSAISIFMIYILYFGKLIKKKIWWLMMLIGWGLPLPIVIPTFAVGVYRNQYINIGDHCFLSYLNGIIWAFLGPFVVLIIASFVGAIISVIKILIIHKEEDLPQDFEAMKKLNVTILVLLPVLSVPWIIGVVNTFLTSALTVIVVEWVTILFTAPVGILFFFLVILRNTEVQEVIFKKKTVAIFAQEVETGKIDEKRKIDAPTSPQEVYTTLGKLTTNKD